MKKIIRNITQRYLLALAILAFFSVLSFILFLKNKKATDQYGYLINLSGRQRFLSQRISFLSSEFVNNSLSRDSIRLELKRAINQMAKDHQLLVHDSVSKTSFYHSHAIDSIYFSSPLFLNKWVDIFLFAAKELAQSKPDEINRQNTYFNYILAASNGLLEGLNSIVAEYQTENDGAVRANYIRKINMVIGSLIAYTLIGVVIFLPMTRRIKKALIDIKKKEAEVEVINKEHVAALIDAQESERHRLAADLHDGLIQTLTCLSYELENDRSAESSLRNMNPEVTSLLNAAIIETRNIAYSIVSPVLREFGLKSAVRALCKQISSQYKISIDVQLYQDRDRFCERLELNLYRIIQEALNNTVKHAQAKAAKVQLIKHPTSLVLIIEDDGCGFNSKKKTTGIGLINIKERTRMFQGQFHIQSSPEMGTEIMVEIPLTDNIKKNGKDKNFYN